MKIDRIPARARVSFLPGVCAACAVALLSGCMSSPTYGTGKTANAQLLEDLTGVISSETLIASQSRGSEIAYTPRAELVRPASLEVLPEPQQDMASAGNPAWPESPEQRRARIREAATENRDDPNFRPVVITPSTETQEQQRADARARTRERNQGSPTSRRYLSEPPLDYRVPSETAVAGEMGDDEWRKERAAKRAAGGGRSSWRDYVPWL